MPLAVNPKDNQQVFDFALGKIREQGKPATDNAVSCMYRAPNNLRCVAGWLIPDEDYISEMEGSQVKDLVNPARLFFRRNEFDLNLIIAMQEAHDNNAEGPAFVERFNEDMQEVATNFNLQYS